MQTFQGFPQRYHEYFCLFFLIFSSYEKKTTDPDDHDTIPVPVTGLFSDANFRATHNSHSGSLYLIYDNGYWGSIVQQLDLGLRYLEIDLLEKYGNDDFQIGHFELLTAIDHSHGNPSSNKLSDGLKVITDLSGKNPGHDPIIVAIETKNEFTVDEGTFKQFCFGKRSEPSKAGRV